MRVDIRPDERFSARYPHELSARVTICTKDERVFVKEQNGYEGGLTNPMSWERTVEKFHWLTDVPPSFRTSGCDSARIWYHWYHPCFERLAPRRTDAIGPNLFVVPNVK
jgi:hypothetical protein